MIFLPPDLIPFYLNRTEYRRLVLCSHVVNAGHDVLEFHDFLVVLFAPLILVVPYDNPAGIAGPAIAFLPMIVLSLFLERI